MRQAHPLSRQQLFLPQHTAHWPISGLMNEEVAARLPSGRTDEVVPSNYLELFSCWKHRQPQNGGDGKLAGLGANPRALNTEGLPTRLKELEKVLGKGFARMAPGEAVGLSKWPRDG